jgi:hypothetical protein
MLNAVQALPAGPGEPKPDVFPLRERIRFRDSFGLALLELRARSLPFQELAKGPWALFIGIAVHWQGNAEAWPSQETLARFTGWSTRAVRDQADALERSGFIRIRKERRPDGSERLFYAPGLVTLSALAEFVERFPRDRAKALRHQTRSVTPALPPTIAHPAEPAAATPPEEASMEPRDQDLIEPSSSSCEARFASLATSRATEEPRIDIGREDEEVARCALVERMKRKHPTRPAPRWFDAGEIAMVGACTAMLGGDPETKLLAHRDAIAGAFLVSKNGPPTVRFIWQKLDHFLDHLERGRRRRLAEERMARVPGSAARAGPAPNLTRAPCAPRIPREQITADLERIFGPGWGTGVPR